MVYLITIVFIAQIIILLNILCFLLKADKKVLSLTKKFDKGRTKLKWRLRAVSEISSDINKYIIPSIIRKIDLKRQDLLIRLIKNSLQGSAVFMVKNKYKKLLVGLKIGYFFGKGLLKT